MPENQPFELLWAWIGALLWYFTATGYWCYYDIMGKKHWGYAYTVRLRGSVYLHWHSIVELSQFCVHPCRHVLQNRLKLVCEDRWALFLLKPDGSNQVWPDTAHSKDEIFLSTTSVECGHWKWSLWILLGHVNEEHYMSTNCYSKIKSVLSIYASSVNLKCSKTLTLQQISKIKSIESTK